MIVILFFTSPLVMKAFDCADIKKNEHGSIVHRKYKFKTESGKLIKNQVKYKCVYTSLYIQKIMFDNYGKWDKVVDKTTNNEKLVWNNIQLFSDDTTKISIVAFGEEKVNMNYTSFMAYDNNNNDLLSDDSPYKSKLIEFFSKSIIKDDSRKNDFYKTYWLSMNPENWERIVYEKSKERYKDSIYKMNKTSKKCIKPNKKNDFQFITEEKFISVVEEDTVMSNQINFECVHTAFYTSKVMFDKFGKWDKVVYKNSNKPILIWTKKRLFDDINELFTIATDGLESADKTYTSFLAFDSSLNDLLESKSKYKKQLIAYMSELIKNNNPNKREFYESFWSTFYPERWAEIKLYQKRKKRFRNSDIRKKDN
ncbi:hypothetical protein DFQ05_0796 [Winogradskyella wandonensis]|uniref:Uncharacterized protein n=2 Tax=Winogradskyella wandonensis TaxID=1442586 RepID=A0A4R1KVQ5_9FLAO|nr:hypothetical protein DFQ05_0796 [Winogradskyella wandonensis]